MDLRFHVSWEPRILNHNTKKRVKIFNHQNCLRPAHWQILLRFTQEAQIPCGVIKLLQNGNLGVPE